MSCITPYFVNNPHYGKLPNEQSKIPVPCGKCPTCLERRINQWILRLTEEMKIMKHAWFVTLTYNSDHVPITKNGFMSLDKTDLQKYFKRLRKASKHKIKYYAVGEYGSHRKRPHYHAIILGCPPEYIKPAWTQGDIHVGTVTNSSIAYCCKYMAKDQLLTKKQRHARDDRELEKSFMSKRLGLNYIQKRTHWHHADLNRNYAIIDGGLKIPLPRYYREKIYDENQRIKQNFQAKKLAEEKTKELFQQYLLTYPTHTYEQFENDQLKSIDQKLQYYNKNSERKRGF